MISRKELEELIINGLLEIRRAETDLSRRFERLNGSRKDTRAKFLFSLADLEARAARLELLLETLSRSADFAHSAAA